MLDQYDPKSDSFWDNAEFEGDGSVESPIRFTFVGDELRYVGHILNSGDSLETPITIDLRINPFDTASYYTCTLSNDGIYDGENEKDPVIELYEQKAAQTDIEARNASAL